ncbi:MAG: NAD(P)/FAD-dependent oxidoreductase [Candidatus Brockarchaeota archaeon]|nr:NAD(P)/FAD-dependent oxidoreductase [Candidatus Brockarchaeota archaeon]
MATYEFDALVVGGGPAGLSAASAAAKGGARVAVIEKARSIAETVRTSGVTWLPGILELGLPRDLYNPIRRWEIFSTGNELVLEAPEPEACVLDVRGFYQFLAKNAASLGAEIFLGACVRSASYGGARRGVSVTASAPGGTLEFLGKVVIDASGLSTVVGRSLGFAERWERFGVGAEYEAYVERLDAEALALMVGREYSPAGYAWVFPVAENRARIGVGIGRPESGEDPFERLKRLLIERPGPLGKLGRICPIETHLGAVPNQGPRGCTVADGALLAGDSAGQSNPLLLEGIRFAIKFGEKAGEAAGRAAEGSDASKAALGEYETFWKREVWRDFQIGLKVQREWLKLSDREWDEELEAFKPLPAKDALEIFECRFQTRKLLGLVARHAGLARSRTFSAILGGLARP